MIQEEKQEDKKEEQPKKNNDKLLIILMVILVFVAIGYGMYSTLYNFDDTNNNVNENTNTNTNDDNTNNNNTNVNDNTDNKSNSFVITLKDSSDGSSQTISVNVDGAFDNLPTPVKEGRTFDGWYTEEVGGTAVTTSTLYKTVNTTTLYAHWSVKKYKMTFILSNGSPNVVLELEYGAKLEAPADPREDNLIFAGWDKPVPESVPTEDMTFRALWIGVLRTIHFDSNGGTPCDSITVRTNGTYENLPVPTRDGYQFKGWYKDNKTFNDKIVTGMRVRNLTSDITLYANWASNS